MIRILPLEPPTDKPTTCAEPDGLGHVADEPDVDPERADEQPERPQHDGHVRGYFAELGLVRRACCRLPPVCRKRLRRAQAQHAERLRMQASIESVLASIRRKDGAR